METYYNKPLDAAVLRRRVIVQRLPIFVISAIIGIGAVLMTSNNTHLGFLIYAVLLSFIFVVFVFNTIKAIRTEKEIYNSYSLTITENSLIRKKEGLATASISFNSIEQITETKQGYLVIKIQPKSVIIVPPTIERYQEVKALLNEIKPISLAPYKQVLKLIFLLPLFCMALMAGVYLSTNKVIVLICGIVLTMLLSWAFYKIKTNNAIDAKTKRSLWSIPIVFLSIIAVVYYKVFIK